MTHDIRALGVFPCGACRALVALPVGCEHWPAPPPGDDGLIALRNRILRDVRAGVEHPGYELLRSVQRGEPYDGGRASTTRYLVYKLRKKGLITPSPAYALTDAGRRLLDDIEKILRA